MPVKTLSKFSIGSLTLGMTFVVPPKPDQPNIDLKLEIFCY